jgi:hypothetical protein
MWLNILRSILRTKAFCSQILYSYDNYTFNFLRNLARIATLYFYFVNNPFWEGIVCRRRKFPWNIFQHLFLNKIKQWTYCSHVLEFAVHRNIFQPVSKATEFECIVFYCLEILHIDVHGMTDTDHPQIQSLVLMVKTNHSSTCACGIWNWGSNIKAEHRSSKGTWEVLH